MRDSTRTLQGIMPDADTVAEASADMEEAMETAREVNDIMSTPLDTEPVDEDDLLAELDDGVVEGDADIEAILRGEDIAVVDPTAAIPTAPGAGAVATPTDADATA